MAKKRPAQFYHKAYFKPQRVIDNPDEHQEN